jgi:diguanylate cyclase (GGDEF)-like protein
LRLETERGIISNGVKEAMENHPFKVLLVEDNPGDARLIREMLEEARAAKFELLYVDRLDEGLKCLTQQTLDLILLDLSLPDSQGLDTFIKTYTQATKVPIVVLTGLDDEALAVRTIQLGAQDYLIKGELNKNILVRALCYAIERHRMQENIRSLSLVDELTGLYNRRGFLTLASQQLKLANRLKKRMLLIFADLDGMKRINDTLGHQEGDKALIEIAKILKETFRESDIIARLGGDEFVVLTLEKSVSSDDAITKRLQERLNSQNAHGNRRYCLSLSLGVAHHDPEHPCSIDEWLAKADLSMYQQKRGVGREWNGS